MLFFTLKDKSFVECCGCLHNTAVLIRIRITNIEISPIFHSLSSSHHSAVEHSKTDSTTKIKRLLLKYSIKITNFARS